MFGRTSPAVVVAGAGPAGLLGALCLVEHRVPVELIGSSSHDPAKRLRRWRASACLLHPRSLALLDRHGAAADVLARAQPVRTLGIYSGARHLGTLSFEQAARERGLPFPCAAVVSQADLDECLREALRRRHVPVRDQRRLARIEQGTARVRVTIDHLESDSAGYATAHSELVVYDSKELEPELVFAADGPRSLVRQQLGLGFRQLRHPERFVVFQAQARGALPRDALLVLGDAGSLALWPLPDERYQGIASVDGEAPERTRPPPEATAGAYGLRPPAEPLAARLARLAPQLAPCLGEIEERGQLEVEYGVASAWGEGRVWLAGGAAHATSPLASQGLNVSLCEATRLAELFAAILRGEAPLDALAAHADERARDWRRLLGLTPARREPEPAALAGAPGYQRLAPCIPACGADFDALLEQLPFTDGGELA